MVEVCWAGVCHIYCYQAMLQKPMGNQITQFWQIWIRLWLKSLWWLEAQKFWARSSSSLTAVGRNRWTLLRKLITLENKVRRMGVIWRFNIVAAAAVASITIFSNLETFRLVQLEWPLGLLIKIFLTIEQFFLQYCSHQHWMGSNDY